MDINTFFGHLSTIYVLLAINLTITAMLLADSLRKGK